MLGERLKTLRKHEGLTQQELADSLNISRVNYSRYENNSVRPDYETIIKIADHFDVSLDDLLGRTK